MTTKRTQTKGKAVDWSLAPRGTASAATEAALGLTALAAVGDAAHASPVLGATLGVAGALGHVLATIRHDPPPAALAYRMSCWAGAGGWLTWSLLTTPWSTNTLAGLGIGAVVAGLCAPLGKIRPKGGQNSPGVAVVLQGGGRIGRTWQARIAQVCRVQVTVTDVEDWPTRTGYNVYLDLPMDGTTVDHLARHAKALATHARLPRGCKVDVEEGDLQGQVLLRVATVNRLHEELPYIADYTPRSILDGVELGEYQDGTAVVVPLRQETALAVGKTGSGKTNLLDLFTGEIALCTDALVWHIDLNGGGMTWSWVKPWLDGEADRPAVDWAASSPQEALAMVQIAYAIALDRKGTSHHLKVTGNSRLMPISPQLPEIVIVVDEGKTVLSGNATGLIGQIRDMLTKIQDESRDAAVRLVTSGLRATSSAIDSDFKAQTGVKIGLPVEKDAELAYLFDWDAGLKCTDLPTPGCGYVQYGQQTPRMFKTRHMLPSDIHAVAVAAARTRPELDDAAHRIAGQIYAERYDRMRAFFGRVTSRNGHQATAELVPATPTTPATTAYSHQPAPTGRPHLSVINGGSTADQWADPAVLIGTITNPPAAPADATAWPDPAPTTTATATLTPPALPAQQIPEPLARAIAVIEAAGDDRMHSEALADALGVRDVWALADLLRPYGVYSRPKFKRGGIRQRGYWLDDLRAAAAGRPVHRDDIDMTAQEA